MINDADTRIEVRGSARVPCTANAVAIQIGIETRRKPDEAAARQRLLTKTERVRRAIEVAGASVRRRRVHNPSLELERELEAPYRPVGWAGRQRIDLEVIDLATARDVVAEARKVGAIVDRVAWLVDITNPAYREARVAAAADARSRANAFAEGLGVEVGRVVRLSDCGGQGTEMSLGGLDDDHADLSESDDAMLLHVSGDVAVSFEVGAPRF